jgi:hypothetical protein
VEITGLRVSLNGVTQRQIEGLFKLIETNDNPITITRTSNPKFAFSHTDLQLSGNFSYEFLQNFSRLFPSILTMNVDVENDYNIIQNLSNYAILVWELEKTIYLGPTILEVELLRKIIPINENIDFLKLLFLTPAITYLKNYILTKPKGFITALDNTLELVLPQQRADFLYLWLNRVKNGEPIDIDWISGSSEELPEELTLKQGLPDAFQQNFENWLKVAQTNSIDDFDLTYRSILSKLV